MRKSILMACLTLGLSGALPLRAEDLLQIYDLAVQSDPVLKQAEQNLLATKETKPQALALLLPDFSISGSGQYQSTNAFNSGPGGSDLHDSYTNGSAKAEVKQVVYNRGYWISLQKSEDTISKAEADFKTSQIDLMARTTTAYFDVLKAADLVRVSEALMRANERQLEQSRQRFDVGLVAITDVNESQSEYDRARAQVISNKNALDNAWESLRVIIGITDVPLARLGDNLPLTPPEPNDINVWSKMALENNYEIQAASQAVAAAKKDIEIQRSGHYPTLALQGGYQLQGTGSEVFGGYDGNSTYVGLSLTVPIYQGGAVTSRTRQAGYSLGSSQEQLDQVRRKIQKNVTNAFRGVLSSISEVQARKTALVSATSSFESAQAGLEVGTRTQVDVLNEQRKLYEAEYQYLLSRYQYIINGVQLFQATGGLNREVLERGNTWLNPADKLPPPSY